MEYEGVRQFKVDRVHQYKIGEWERRHPAFVEVMKAIQGLGFVAGGYIRHLYVADAPKPSDMDVFLLGRDNFDKIVMELERVGYQKGTESRAAVTYFKSRPEEKDEIEVQLVRPVGQTSNRGRSGTPQEVMSTFEFTTNQFAVEMDGTGGYHLTFGERAFEDSQSKRLILVNPFNPLALIYRIMKYAAKGYWMPRSEGVKLFLAWDQASPKLKAWAITEMAKPANEQDMDILYALTDGLIGEESLD